MTTTRYAVTYRPEGDPRRAPKAPVTRKFEVVLAFTSGTRHFVKFTPARGYCETLEVREIIRIEVA